MPPLYFFLTFARSQTKHQISSLSFYQFKITKYITYCHRFCKRYLTIILNVFTYNMSVFLSSYIWKKGCFITDSWSLWVSSGSFSSGMSSILSWFKISSSDSPMSEKSSAALSSPCSSVLVGSCGLLSGTDLSRLFLFEDLSELDLFWVDEVGKGFFCCNAWGGSSLSFDLKIIQKLNFNYNLTKHSPG